MEILVSSDSHASMRCCFLSRWLHVSALYEVRALCACPGSLSQTRSHTLRISLRPSLLPHTSHPPPPGRSSRREVPFRPQPITNTSSASARQVPVQCTGTTLTRADQGFGRRGGGVAVLTKRPAAGSLQQVDGSAPGRMASGLETEGVSVRKRGPDLPTN